MRARFPTLLLVAARACAKPSTTVLHGAASTVEKLNANAERTGMSTATSLAKATGPQAFMENMLPNPAKQKVINKFIDTGIVAPASDALGVKPGLLSAEKFGESARKGFELVRVSAPVTFSDKPAAEKISEQWHAISQIVSYSPSPPPPCKSADCYRARAHVENPMLKGGGEPLPPAQLIGWKWEIADWFCMDGGPQILARSNMTAYCRNHKMQFLMKDAATAAQKHDFDTLKTIQKIEGEIRKDGHVLKDELTDLCDENSNGKIDHSGDSEDSFESKCMTASKKALMEAEETAAFFNFCEPSTRVRGAAPPDEQICQNTYMNYYYNDLIERADVQQFLKEHQEFGIVVDSVELQKENDARIQDLEKQIAEKRTENLRLSKISELEAQIARLKDTSRARVRARARR